MPYLPKTIRKVSYRNGGYEYPAIILEGRWLEKNYNIRIGDYVDVAYGGDTIRIKKSEKERDKNQSSLFD